MTSYADGRGDILDEGKVAITKYRWLQSHSSGTRPRSTLSLFELSPMTGRTHQIRVHLSEQLKVPIYGDYRYWHDQPSGRHLHLHSRSITLRGWLGVGRDLRVKAPIPPHFVESMSKAYKLRLNEIPKFK
jgi:23S rRNA-/tRNA-specific pseudouridylate synthase